MPSVTMSIKDYSNQTGSSTFFTSAITQNPENLVTAINAVIHGAVNWYTASNKTVLTGALPTSKDAQRGDKLIITYADDVTGEYGTVAIPNVNRTVLTIPSGSDLVDLADAGVMAALVLELETNYLSRDGNAITVVQARVGERTN